jgi:hypothetical protein
VLLLCFWGWLANTFSVFTEPQNFETRCRRKRVCDLQAAGTTHSAAVMRL